MEVDKFCDVLKIVAENGHLGAKEMIKMSKYIGEEHQILGWKKRTENYEKNIKKDDIVEGPRVNFDKSVDICSTTRAKQEFKLDEDDLFPLPYKMVYVYVARQYFPFYKTSDIKTIMYEKYGKYKVKEIFQRKEKRQSRKDELQEKRHEDITCFINNKVRSIRNSFEKMKDMDSSSPIIFEILNDFPKKIWNTTYIKQFESNGKQKKKLKWYIETFFDNLLHFLECIDPKNISMSIILESIDYENQKSIVKEKISEMLTKKERHENLRQALSKFGLSIRSDSFVCNEFLQGNRNDIDEVVEIMREMHFYFTYTIYPSYIKQEYDYIFRRRGKRRYRDFDFDDYDSESDDDSDYEIDRAQISEDCKKQALRSLFKTTQHKKDKKWVPIPKNILELFRNLKLKEEGHIIIDNDILSIAI